MADVERLFNSISANARGDTMAICRQGDLNGPLRLSKLREHDADGRPTVRLYKTDVASVKDGQFLVRTTAAGLSKKDYFAYVPYVGDGGRPPSEGGGHCDHMLLKVNSIYAWCEREGDQRETVYRFAVGEMTALEPKGEVAYGYELEYWDGSNGHAARKPSLLGKPARAQSYLYGVWLSQIDCTLVSTSNEKFFIPTLKLAHFG